MLFDDAILIGKITKSRSAKGDVQINLTNISADMFDGDFLIINVDGLKVPFKIDEIEERGNCMLVKFEECNGKYDDIVGCDVYCRKEDLEELTEDSLSLNPNVLKGFKIIDSALGNLGEVTAVDTSTANIVLYVHGKEEILIPLAEEFIEEFNTSDRIIRLSLPDGLVSINEKNSTQED